MLIFFPSKNPKPLRVPLCCGEGYLLFYTADLKFLCYTSKWWIDNRYLVVSFQKGNENMSHSFEMENKLVDNVEFCLMLLENQVHLNLSSSAEFMINLCPKLYSLSCCDPVPLGIEENQRKEGFEVEQDPAGPPYKSPFLSSISCLLKAITTNSSKFYLSSKQQSQAVKEHTNKRKAGKQEK